MFLQDNVDSLNNLAYKNEIEKDGITTPQRI
jgi:hypothetical protein